MSHNQDRHHEHEPLPAVIDLAYLVRLILRLELRIMSQLDQQAADLIAALQTLQAGNADILTVVQQRNDNDDALLTSVGNLETLVQRLFDASNQGGTVTNVDLQPALDLVKAIGAQQQAAKDALVSGVSKVVDATAAAAALVVADTPPPAPAPAPSPAPAPAPSTPPDTTGSGDTSAGAGDTSGSTGTGGDASGSTGDGTGDGSVPTPTSDDAFVAVGATRFSDGQPQTAESLAAAVAVWNAAHPDGPVAS